MRGDLRWKGLTGVPDGYHVEPTGQVVAVYSTHWFKRAAEKRARAGTPLVPSYRLVIEKKGLFRYEVIAYQNILVQDDPSGGN